MDERDDEFDTRLRWPGGEDAEAADSAYEQGGAEDGGRFVAADPTGDAGGYADPGTPSRLPPMLPAIAGRLENVQGAIATFALRLDGITASFEALRSALSDRL